MHDFMVLRAHFQIRAVPGQGRCSLQHLTRGCAAGAHGLNKVTNAARAIRVLIAVLLLIAGRLRDFDLGPIGFHLVGHHHGQAGAGTGSHFRTMGDDGDRAIRRDGNKDMRIPHHATGHTVRARLECVNRSAVRKGGTRKDLSGHNEPASAHNAFQNVTTAHIGDNCAALLEDFRVHFMLLSRRL